MPSTRRQFLGQTVLASASASAAVASPGRTAAKAVVRPKVPDLFVGALNQARGGEGLLDRFVRVNERERLMKLRLEDILAPFLHRPGVQEWVGEHVGKWLHAAVLSFQHTGSAELWKKVEETARILVSAQAPDGYLGTYLDKDRWTSWDVWSHKYNLLGLLAYHEESGDRAALDACRRMGDLLCKTFGTGPGQLDIVHARHSTHVGMASSSVLEPMVLLYRQTGEKRYLDFAHTIVAAWEQPHGPKILSSLLAHGNVRKTANNKAYEMTSCLVGVLELYRTTGEARLLRACTNAWQDIRDRRSYATGTSSWNEHFQEDLDLRPDGVYEGQKYAAAGEGCVTVTWMQMTWQLLRLTGEAKYAEELERTTYNALVGAQSPRTGQVAYFIPMVGRKRYGEVDHGITPDICCCASSQPRGIALSTQLMAGTVAGAPTVLLYNPGRYTLAARPKGSKAGQEVATTIDVRSSYPESGRVTIQLHPARPAELALRLRVPRWAKQFTASVGGAKRTGQPGTWLTLERRWSAGDTVTVDMDLPLRVEPAGKSAPGKVIVTRGPQVLAEDASLRGREKLPGGWIGRQIYVVETKEERRKVALVPFADAGQTRADYTVLVDEPA